MINAAIDIETTGLTPGVQEICEISVVIFNDNFEPTGLHFESRIRPMRPFTAQETAFKVNGLSLELLKVAPTPNQVLASFLDWKVELFLDEKIAPLGHRYDSFDSCFIKTWMDENYYRIFHTKYVRDSYFLARGLSDAGVLKVEGGISLPNLMEYFGIREKYKAHTSYDDACASLEVYKRLLNLCK